MEQLETILYLSEIEKSWIDTSLNEMLNKLSRKNALSLSDQIKLENLIEKINDL